MRKVRAVSLLGILLLSAGGIGHGSSIEYVEQAGAAVAAAALQYLGAPYRSGGADSAGFDCSGLVYRAYLAASGTAVPRTVAGLAAQGVKVQGSMRAGDLVFFDTTGGPSHVGIALDASSFVHAASEGPATGVIVSRIEEPYYRERFLEARRLLAPSPGRFSVRIDERPVRALLAEGLRAGTPLGFLVGAADGAGRVVVLRAEREGEEVLARRMRVASGDLVEVWLVPDAGRWSVRVEEDGQVLAELAFEAGGAP